MPDWMRDDPRVVYVHERPAAVPIEAQWPTWVPTDILDRLTVAGLATPWRHQVEAADATFHGRHVALATGTASGKTASYLVPVMAATASTSPVVGEQQRADIESARRAGIVGVRHAALYLAPTKALAHDQLRVCEELGPKGWRVTTLDGDSDTEERRFAREFATYVLTNPDMLHRSVLANHARWRTLLGSLRYVVVDEAHRYRGVFGAHVALVLRRLRRLCAQYGADPTFVCSSATSSNAVEAMSRLISEPESAITAVDWDASPRGARSFVLWQPGDTTDHDAADLMARLVDEGRQTLTFVSSRKSAELVTVRAKRRVESGAGVAAYRGGYLAGDRRSIEARLQSGALRGVAATNALELGVDIAGMDAVVIAGFPGTLASLWQQAGRAGRRGTDALVVLVARENPLDAYLFEHPDLIFDAGVEATVLHPENPHVLGPHLAAAAQEAHLTEADERWFSPTMWPVLDRLVAHGTLRRRASGWFWTHPARAVDSIDLRAMGGSAVDIIESLSGRVIGSVDPAAADVSVHPGAVYLHQGEQWIVEELDVDNRHALVRAERPGYYTQARSTSAIHILREGARRSLGSGVVSVGAVELTSQVVGYLRRDEVTSDVWDETPLDMPERQLRTQAVWWTLPADQLSALGLPPARLGAAAHAAEHTAIGLLPAFAPCDRWDIGGLSTVLHPETETLTVFVHDGHPGGAGFASAGFERAEEWLTATLGRLGSCSCASGCPQCCVSPKCGNANQMLDKEGAIRLLRLLVG